MKDFYGVGEGEIEGKILKKRNKKLGKLLDIRLRIAFPKKKKPKKSYLKKKAWDMFSKYIRKSAIPPGLVGTISCYTCGNQNLWQAMDAGHGIEGRNNAVLFMEEVVKPQCRQCNIFKHGNLRRFTRKLIEELGIKRYDKLVVLSNQIIQYKSQDFRNIYEKYKRLLLTLEND